MEKQRIHIEICGAVQGVGFRPFVYNLAQELELTGWVNNTSSGVSIEAEGDSKNLESFLLRLKTEKPSIASIYSFQFSYLDLKGFEGFEILQSESASKKTTVILPDIATCLDCRADFFNKKNRRYLYPFTNCTHCGPRYSIIENIPYDRKNTSMNNFVMCEDCQAEYDDPQNRRFHAQPNACPKCGPQVELWDRKGDSLSQGQDAIDKVISSIRDGKIVAIKGLGGFHLCVDAINDAAVQDLRERKHREEKPFAIMVPDLEFASQICEINALEEELLTSSEAPIVLLKKKKDCDKYISSKISPGNPYLGVILPYTPLHHILMKELGSPIVATSANLSDDTICFDEKDALERLKLIADLFLVHNRPIVRHVDDSIVRLMNGRPQVLRRARGYAPLGINMKKTGPSILALGAHLKNTVALSVESNVMVSQHIGDLETAQSLETFNKTRNDLSQLYESDVSKLAFDMHPEYLSTKQAMSYKGNVTKVQHHHAHIVSCMAENELDGEVLGIAWDGTGFGVDNTIWGGEFLLSTLSDFKRVGCFKQFSLPGGDAAVKEPRRVGLSLLSQIFGKDVSRYYNLATFQSFTEHEMITINEMITKSVNSPLTSSVGRLFDGVASLLGLNQKVRHEGHAAMALEFSIGEEVTDAKYKVKMPVENTMIIIDWEPMIREIIEDLRKGKKTAKIAAKFHNTLADVIVKFAKKIDNNRVVLSGGCFQNKYLTEKAIGYLIREGFKPYWHQRIPPNDGGISLGQAVVALNRP